MLSMDEQTRTALETDDEAPASALELAAAAWRPYFHYIEPGVISEHCAYGQMLEALVLVANDVHVDDEEMFEAASESVTLRPERLDLKLDGEAHESYQEAARVVMHKHRRNLVELLLTLGILYGTESSRPELRDWQIARDDLAVLDPMTEPLKDEETPHWTAPTRDDVLRMHGDLLVLGPRMERYNDNLACVREHLVRLALLAKARHATYHALARVTRAAYWMDEHRNG